MRQIVLTLIVALQAIFFSGAHAWSPIDEVHSAVESMQHCNWIVAGSDDSQKGENKANAEGEDEEPDCD